MLRLFVFWFVAFTIAVTSFPETSFAQNSTFWMLQRQNNDRMMRENQRRMEQQRRDAERRRIEMERQRQIRRQQQEQQRRIAQQRQKDMQARQQKLAAERRKMADQRRLEQQRRQQEIQKQQAQRKQLQQQQAQRTQLAARNRAVQLERQRRLQQIQQRNRLTQQNQQAQTAAQQSGTVAMLARQSSTARAATVASPKFQQRKAEAAARFAKLKGSQASTAKKPTTTTNAAQTSKQLLAKKKIEEFRKRQLAKKQTEKRVKTAKELAALKAKTCSFHGDTLVLTEAGPVPIRDIRIGEHRVWAMDEFTGESGWKDVLAQYSNIYDTRVSISVIDPDSGRTQTILSNEIHPFFTLPSADELTLQLVGHSAYFESGEWVEASDLTVGMKLRAADGTWDLVKKIIVEPLSFEAFNLTVSDFHTFFVSDQIGSSPVLVHNTCVKVQSAIKNSPFAIKKTKEMSQAAQRDVDKLQAQLKEGNLMKAGLGSKRIGKYVEMRGRNGGRMLVRQTGPAKYEIVGKFQAHKKGDTENSNTIKKLISDYERQS